MTLPWLGREPNVPYKNSGSRPRLVMGMDKNSYVRGFTDALELVLVELQRAKDLEDARERVRTLYGLALEHKLDEIQRQLGYIPTNCS